MPRIAPSCKKCDQNAQAWEQAAIKLWEVNTELLLTQDTLNDARLRIHDMEQDMKLALNEVDRCRRDHA